MSRLHEFLKLKLDNKRAIIEGLLSCKGEIDFVSGVKLRHQPLVMHFLQGEKFGHTNDFSIAIHR
jgi:hypothetical protein